MIKLCKGCGKEIHPMRIKALPDTSTCVKCSNISMKRCVTVLRGDINKDDTWTDIIFIDEDSHKTHYRDIEDLNEE
jgi:RNA polymerase-binding transcription factor DksA|tara:strand:+ start:889 stop:1116 length:228 start_codon:yes stop_codon:yes gene_type:complete